MKIERNLKCVLIFFIIIQSIQISAQENDNWIKMYPSINRAVLDMEFSYINGISEYGLIFALPGNNGGLAYFTEPDTLNIFSVATNLGVVSVASDFINNRIFCAFGCGSYSDGLYKFDVSSQEFTLIEYSAPPNFVKELSSGYYFGFGWDNTCGGLLYSQDGDEWSSMDYFTSKNVKDVETDSSGRLFVAVGNELFIQDNDTFNSVLTALPINDIYVSSHLNNNSHEIFIACGDGSNNDTVYIVDYENGNINDLIPVNNFHYPYKLYEYYGYLVVGCLDSGGVYFAEPNEMGEKYLVGNFEDIYCYETYPIYCRNIMIGTNDGVYYGGDFLINIDEFNNLDNIEFLNNFPNPFSSYTKINFEISKKSHVKLAVYNINGKLIDVPTDDQKEPGNYSIIWQTAEKNLKEGVYFYSLTTDYFQITKKMIYVK